MEYNELHYQKGKEYETKNTGLTKALIQRLPNIIEIMIDTFSTIANKVVCRGEIGIKNYEIHEDYICCSLAFYGDINFKVMLSFPRDIAEILSSHIDDDLEESLVEFMHIVSLNILESFYNLNINIKTTIPKIFILQNALDKGSMGACINLDIEGKEAILFIAH